MRVLRTGAEEVASDPNAISFGKKTAYFGRGDLSQSVHFLFTIPFILSKHLFTHTQTHRHTHIETHTL